MASDLPAAKSNAVPCAGCGRAVSGPFLMHSMTGRAMCPGCMDGLDAMTCSVLATSGLIGGAATAGWIRRLMHPIRFRVAP